MILKVKLSNRVLTANYHLIACEHCRKEKICNFCSGSLGSLDSGRCTQGRCNSCHRTICSKENAHAKE